MFIFISVLILILILFYFFLFFVWREGRYIPCDVLDTFVTLAACTYIHTRILQDSRTIRSADYVIHHDLSCVARPGE